MTVPVERKSPNSFTEHVANVCVTAGKYLECSCTEPAKPFLNGNGQTTVCGVEKQEAGQVSGNAGDEDADKQREPLLLMHNMSNPPVVALSGTPISVTSGEGPSVLRTRQATDAWLPLQQSARNVAAPIPQTSARDVKGVPIS